MQDSKSPLGMKRIGYGRVESIPSWFGDGWSYRQTTGHPIDYAGTEHIPLEERREKIWATDSPPKIARAIRQPRAYTACRSSRRSRKQTLLPFNLYKARTQKNPQTRDGEPSRATFELQPSLLRAPGEEGTGHGTDGESRTMRESVNTTETSGRECAQVYSIGIHPPTPFLLPPLPFSSFEVAWQSSTPTKP